MAHQNSAIEQPPQGLPSILHRTDLYTPLILFIILALVVLEFRNTRRRHISKSYELMKQKYATNPWFRELHSSYLAYSEARKLRNDFKFSIDSAAREASQSQFQTVQNNLHAKLYLVSNQVSNEELTTIKAYFKLL